MVSSVVQKISRRLSLVPRPRRGGEKAAWYLLHAHARSTPTEPGAPNTTVYFPHFPPVYVSKLLRVIQMIYAITSESTDWYVSYAPTDNPTRWYPLLKLAEVAGSILEAPSPNLVVVNRILDTSDTYEDRMKLLC